MKGINKVISRIFIFCLFLFVNYSYVSASSIPLDSYKTTILEPPDLFPDQPHIAACMNFGETSYGHITLGIRTGICALFYLPPAIGIGIGADLRVRCSRHIEIEGYTDYFHTNILNKGYRNTVDFGFNLLYIWVERPFIAKHFTPFLLAGISVNNNDIRSEAYYTGAFQDWSPWLNLGVGEHYYVTKRFDISLEAYYAIPLGIHPISYFTDTEKGDYLSVKNEGAFHPGGIFVILSFNYTFGVI